MPKLAQINRLDKVNKLISFISKLDNELHYDDNAAMFKIIIDGINHGVTRFQFIRNKIYYIDKSCIYPYSNTDYSKWFTGDKILWALVNDMREYIITGNHSNGNNGYNGLYYPKWGINWTSECRDLVIEKAKELGYLGKSDPTFCEFLNKKIYAKFPELLRNY